MNSRDLALAYAAVEGKQWEAAARYCRNAIESGDRVAVQLLAVIRYKQSDFGAAIELLEAAKDAGELTSDGAARLVRLQLLAGNARDGWNLLRDCCHNNVFGPELYPLPRWRGEPLTSRKVVVWGAGYGDEIFFIRYAPLLAATGAHVYVNCRPALTRLFCTVTGVHEALPLEVEVSDADYQLNTAELPSHFGAADGRYWPEGRPYIHADPIKVQGKSGRVGIVWAADSRHLEADDRTAALADMIALVEVSGIRLYSLQVGRYAAQQSPPPAGMVINELSVGFPDFAEQAAQIMGLDLVITVDTAVANLAGALGARVWVAVPHIPDWRWGLEGDTTPWYPSARVYRQTSPGDWRGVFRRMARDLTLLGSDKRYESMAK